MIAAGPDSQTLGWIGVGRMGNHMAGRLLEAGYAVTIYDTNETAMQRLEQRGAKRAASAADVAAQCETVPDIPSDARQLANAIGHSGYCIRVWCTNGLSFRTQFPPVGAYVYATRHAV